ncbi:MAG TPA: ATP-binding protein [Bdellovibrio sp.]|uniref:ATP-binding protein n=1 Tax=Bdellovibrio sp. TaxID=28201 RepID=UPI002EF14706
MDRQLALAKGNPEIRKIFEEQSTEICIRVDQAFAFLMGIQWFGAILTAWLISPSTWLGPANHAQEGLILGFVLGGVFALPPMFLAWSAPGEKITRYTIAICQVLFSSLFIHLSGGRIETHFHIFVSLALLAFYKDFGLLVIASFIVASDHYLRGFWIPMSIYGTDTDAHHRWVEHTLWVIFEDVVLFMGIHKIREELWDMARSKYELTVAKEEAVRISTLKSTFLSNMSHEIRTPLNSIIGFTDVLRDTELNSDQKQYTETIHRCSESLQVLIDDILDFSKIENGLMQIDRHQFDLHQLHHDVRNMFLVRCREKGLEFEVVLDQDLPQLAVGDSHRIKQILINLVGNAVKFTERGGISIHVTRDMNVPSSFHWKIVDTGVGIAKEHQQKLFGNFTQATPSISRRYGGSGLGLMISKNLIELMGGKIFLESQLGEGSTFSFTLPFET